MSIKIAGGSSGNLAEVSSNNQVQVNLPSVLTQSGYAIAVGQNWDGSSGAAEIARATQVSIDGRLRTGIDGVAWMDTFNHTIQDSGSYSINTTTFTLSMAAGIWAFNSGAVTTGSAVGRVQTYKTFPIQNAQLEVGFRVKFTQNAQANNGMELGLGYASAITTPTDGVYFKMDASGALLGCANFNGTEFTVSTGVSIVASTFYYLKMIVDDMRAEFYVNNACKCKIDLSDVTASYASDSLCMSRNLPLLMRFYNTASAPSLAQQMQVADIYVFQEDIQTNRPWPVAQSAQGMNAVNVPRGIAAGDAANYANSTIPTSATLSNTTAGYATLGGQWQFAAVGGAETDYALFAYQVGSVPAVGTGSKNLVVTGVHIGCFNMGAAAATTPTLLQWAVGVGSTAVSLATTDSATAGTRRPRIITIGSQSIPVGAVVGANVPDLDIQFNSPLYVEAGTFIHIILKIPTATATASQIVRGTCAINGYYE